VKGRRVKKLNVVAGLLNGKLICPTKYEWNTDSAWFLEWLEWFLFPLLTVGCVIVLDNACFHKKAEVHRIAASYGCRAIFLPPYSPDKNKIEKSWANLKNWLRLNAKKYDDINDAIMDWFKSDWL
jgi:transposase